MNRPTPTVICLTPVWNEAWILEQFLDRASMWADHIVIADQGSEDGSREIGRSHPKVMLVDNTHSGYDEAARQRLLLDAARTFPGPRLLIALDADEALTADVLDSRGWRAALSARPGTVIRLPWVNLLPDSPAAWVPQESVVFGLADNETSHTGSRIHNMRLPVDPGAPILELEDVGVIHFQYLDPERMLAKQRWYQCFERLEFPDKRPAEIYRQYHHMDAWPSEEIRSVNPAWVIGLDKSRALPEESSRAGRDLWNHRVLDLMREHGPEAFRKVDIWNIDWVAEANQLGVDPLTDLFADPQSSLDRLVLRWLRYAQPRRGSSVVRAVSRSLKVLGW